MTAIQTSEHQLLARAMKDEPFRQELLTNPKTLLERELGITIPQGVTIQVHEDTPTTVHLVLPAKAPTGDPREDADAVYEITAVTGQRDYILGSTYPSCWTVDTQADCGCGTVPPNC